MPLPLSTPVAMTKSKTSRTKKKSPRSKVPVPVRAVDFIMYRAKKPLQTRAWYQRLFGFKAGEEWHKGWSEFATEPVSVCLDGPPFDQESPDLSRGGGGAVAFAVDDIHAAAAELRKRRVNIVRGPIETGVCWMLFIRDPEGNNLVIHQRKNGTAG